VEELAMFKELAPLVLRLLLAGIFIFHGQGKIFGPDNFWGTRWALNFWTKEALPPKELLDPENLSSLQHILQKDLNKKVSTSDLKHAITVFYKNQETRPPITLEYFWAQLAVAWGELVGGVALLLGCLTRLAALGLIIIQVGAVVMVTWSKGFFAAVGGYEYNLALLAMCLALVLQGGGRFAVDRLWVRKPKPAAANPPGVIAGAASGAEVMPGR